MTRPLWPSQPHVHPHWPPWSPRMYPALSLPARGPVITPAHPSSPSYNRQSTHFDSETLHSEKCFMSVSEFGKPDLPWGLLSRPQAKDWPLVMWGPHLSLGWACLNPSGGQRKYVFYRNMLNKAIYKNSKQRIFSRKKKDGPHGFGGP